MNHYETAWNDSHYIHSVNSGVYFTDSIQLNCFEQENPNKLNDRCQSFLVESVF